MKPGPEFFQSLVEVSHIEFQSYDFHEHKLIFSSGIAQQILGYSFEEYSGFSRNFYQDLVHPDDKHILLQAIDRIIHSLKGEVVELTARFRRSDNNYVWVYSRQIVTERAENGDPCTITRVVEDITELMRLKDELREKVQQLESISFKNSHLIRSPVASIIGLINLVEEEHITNEHNMEIFRFLKQAMEKLDIVIHEINDLAT
jgi:PAS domain S-box-containing protein